MTRQIATLPLLPGFWLTERVHWSLGLLWNLSIGPALFVAGFFVALLACPGLLIHAALWSRADQVKHQGARLLSAAVLGIASIAICSVYVLPLIVTENSPYETPQ